MKNYFLISIFAAMIAMAAIGCGTRRDEVVVIEKTKSYHTASCPKVNMAATKTMPVAEAKAAHLKPCAGCKPDAHVQ